MIILRFRLIGMVITLVKIEQSNRWNKIRNVFLGLSDAIWVIGLAGLGGALGFTLNVAIARWSGAANLGVIVRMMGLAAILGSPGSLIGPQVVRWIAQKSNWKRLARAYQGLALSVGLAWVAILWSLHVPARILGEPIAPGMSAPLALLVAPMLVPGIQYAVAQGRAKYRWMSLIAVAPVILRVFLVFANKILVGEVTTVSVIWMTVAASWLGMLLSVTLIEKLPSDQVIATDSQSNWLNLTLIGILVNTWLNWDVVWIVRWSGPFATAAIGVIATIGKIPYHLLAGVANLSIGEHFWHRSQRRAFLLLVGILGGGCLGVLGVFWGSLERLFRLGTHIPLVHVAVLAYVINAIGVVLWYHDAVARVDNREHSWIAVALWLAAWSVGVPILRHLAGPVPLWVSCIGLASASIGAWISTLLSPLRQRASQTSRP